MEIILLFLILFWFCHIQQRIFYSLYFWQLKEYRLDRFLEEAKRTKSFIFPKVSFFAFSLFLFLVFWDASFPKLYLVVLFYFVLGIYSLRLLAARKLRLPKFTKKMLALCALCFLLLVFFVLYFIEFEFILFLLIFEILFPAFIFICVETLQIPSILIKKRIFRKAEQKRKKFKDLLVIGITGSYGKTSTKEFLYAILSQKYNVLKTQGNNNTEIGVANTILRKLEKEHQIFICEMAAYKIGEIKTICEIAKPKIGILTGINEQHLALFGSQGNIVKAKFELIESLPEDGVAILNADCEKLGFSSLRGAEPYWARRRGNLFLFSSQQEIATRGSTPPRNDRGSGSIDVWAEDVEVGKEDVKFKVCVKDGDSAEFKVGLLGAQSISNVLGAVVCAKELGMELKEIARACEKIEPMRGSGRLIKSMHGFNIIDATYSANPDSVLAHLDYLKQWKGRKVVVMPCLIELGSQFNDVHQRIGAKIAENCDLAIITKKECYDIMKNSAIQSGMDKNKILFMQNTQGIFDKLKNFNNSEDVILLESRVPKPLVEMLKI